MCGVLFGFSFSVPSLASLSAILLPLMHVCALTLFLCGSYVRSNKFDIQWLHTLYHYNS